MKKAYNAPKVEKLDFAETSSVTETILSSTGEITTIPTPPEEDNGDVGRGRGRGGGCDGVPYDRNARTFSSGRNSGC